MWRAVLLLASLAVSAALAVACSSGPTGFLEGLPDSGAVSSQGGGTGASSSSSSSGGASSDGGADDAGALVPIDASSLGLGDASASCSIGPAGIVALIPGETMAPGTSCPTCHATAIGGTVYRTLTDGNLCLGVPGGMSVVITDAQGGAHTLTVDTSGNFFQVTMLGIPTPYQAKVVDSSGASVAMVSSQTSGDCNSCHTPTGAQGAGGRIIGP